MADVWVKFEPDNARVGVPRGTLVLVAARRAGVPIESLCGGRGVCGKCLCRIVEGEIAEEGEQRAVLGAQYEAGLRLACQTRLLSDATVYVPQEARVSTPQILEQAAFSLGERAPQPAVRKVYVTLPRPSLSDPRGDLERLLDALREGGVAEPRCPHVRALRELPRLLRQADFAVTALLRENELLAVEPGETTSELYGIALDLGTTTVVGYLVDLRTGERLACASTLNDQVQFGDDVVSRISFAAQGAEQRRELQRAALSSANRVIEQACAQAKVVRERVSLATFVGNTCMSHLFWGIDPFALAQAPYTAAVQQGLEAPAGEVGLGIAPGALVRWLPNIAGWVGADTVGVILATGMHRSQDVWLAIDIGTNGEVVLGNRERLLACSCAAGPAFEGSQIRQGMRGAEGAVDHVDILDGSVTYTTIGGAPARGICGSGLVDAVASLRRAGLVDESGRLANEQTLADDVSPDLRARLVEIDGQPAFVIVSAEESALAEPVALTQRDIRQLQLAKGAIAAGVRILLDEAGLEPGDVRRVLLAGAFGWYIRQSSAAEIGLFPRELEERAEAVGNAAGAGAYLALVSEELFAEAQEIARRVTYIELAGRPEFDSAFAEAMLFSPGEREAG